MIFGTLAKLPLCYKRYVLVHPRLHLPWCYGRYRYLTGTASSSTNSYAYGSVLLNADCCASSLYTVRVPQLCCHFVLLKFTYIVIEKMQPTATLIPKYCTVGVLHT